MKTSAAAMKSSVKEADLDKADELMDDINEAMDAVQEMNEAMSQPLGQVMDDDELEAELAELEEMEADEILSDLPSAHVNKAHAEMEEELDLPEAPSKKVAKQKVEEENEDAELAELEAMMG